ncbi:MAG TPA: glycosyltransferase family 1 protein [Gaiellaceae bacterium]|nr:glycosyltransferase family 1 protein [Gaiellaceae bacterium]
MSAPLVVVDADVLGRQRTGDETYVENLLARLPALAGNELRFAALTRRPELVPAGVEAVHVPARSQELRMLRSVPRALRKLGAALAHFQHAMPLRCPCPAVVTVHDLSFERDPSVMRRRHRAVFRLAVPYAVRHAAHVLAVSERTKDDLVELYSVDPQRVTVTPHGVDASFTPGEPAADPYLLLVGAVEPRKNPLAAADAAAELGMRLVVVGPGRDPELVRALEERGADVRGYVPKPQLVELYRGAAALVFPSRYEGFGLPVIEAMASGAPVVAAPDAAVREIADGAAVFAEPGELADGVRRALADRDRLVAAGLQRAAQFSWDETARRTLDVYRQVLGLT